MKEDTGDLGFFFLLSSNFAAVLVLRLSLKLLIHPSYWVTQYLTVINEDYTRYAVVFTNPMIITRSTAISPRDCTAGAPLTLSLEPTGPITCL